RQEPPDRNFRRAGSPRGRLLAPDGSGRADRDRPAHARSQQTAFYQPREPDRSGVGPPTRAGLLHPLSHPGADAAGRHRSRTPETPLQLSPQFSFFRNIGFAAPPLHNRMGATAGGGLL